MRNKKTTESLTIMQEQAKATDYKSAACTNSDDNREHQSRVLAAVRGFYAGRKQGKRRRHRRTRSLQGTETTRRNNNAIHRLSGILSGVQVVRDSIKVVCRPTGSLLAVRSGSQESKAGPLKKSTTPQSLLAAYSNNTNTCKLPAGVNP